MPRPRRFDPTLTHVARERAKANDQVTHLVNSDVPYARPRTMHSIPIEAGWYGSLRLVAGTPSVELLTPADWWEGTEAYLYVSLIVMGLDGGFGSTETMSVQVEVANLTDGEVLDHTWTCTNADIKASVPSAGIETASILLSSGAHMKLALSGNANLIPGMGQDPGYPLIVKCTLTGIGLAGGDEIHLTYPAFNIVSAYPSRS